MKMRIQYHQRKKHGVINKNIKNQDEADICASTSLVLRGFIKPGTDYYKNDIFNSKNGI